MPQEERDIIYNLQSQEEISELIGNAPSWLLRSGIGMIAFASIMIFAACAFIKYPDKFQGRGILTSSNPPIEIVSNSSGYLQNILVKNQDMIQAGQELFYIENTGSKEDVAKLETWFKQFEAASSLTQIQQLSIPSNLQLGPVQSDYTAITSKFNEFKQAITNGIVSQETNNLTKEIENIEKLNISQNKRKEMLKEEIALLEESLERSQELYKNGLTSLDKLEQSKKDLIQKKGIYQGMEKEIINNDIRIGNLDLEKIKLGKNRKDLIGNYKLDLASLISNTQNKIQDWSKEYSIDSKIAGEIVFKTKLAENKFIDENEVLASVIPKLNAGKFLSIQAPISNIGKIEVGQKILIKFDAYPYKEFGIVESKVYSIGKIPELVGDGNSFYEIKALLDDEITSDYGKEIPFKPGMTANVDIITENKTIASRILNQLFAIGRN